MQQRQTQQQHSNPPQHHHQTMNSSLRNQFPSTTSSHVNGNSTNNNLNNWNVPSQHYHQPPNGMENNGQPHFSQQPVYYDTSFMQQNYYQNQMMNSEIFNRPPYNFYDYNTIQQVHQMFGYPPNMDALNSYYQTGQPTMMYNPMYPYYYPNQHPQENQTNAKQIENELKSLLLGGEQPKPVQNKAVETPSQKEFVNPPKEQLTETVQNSITNSTTEQSDTSPEKTQKKPTKNKKKDQPINFKFGAYRVELDERMLTIPEKLKPIDSFLTSSVTPSILKLYNELIPTQKEIEKRNEFFKNFEKLIINKWSDAKLYMFGSSANGLCLRQLQGKNEYCDVDFCLVVELTPDRMKKIPVSKEVEEEKPNENTETAEEEVVEEQDEEGEESQKTEVKKKSKPKKKLSQEQYHKKNYVSQLKQFLESKLNYTDVKGIFTARIPIVTFTEQNLKINCDIGVNNILAVYNTRLIGLYCNIDIRCKQLIFLIKYWSKQRCINDPFGGTLSSYCLVIMVIHLLQQCDVLPFLQDKTVFTNMKTKIVDGLDGNNYDCSFEESLDEINKKITKKDDSLGSLLLKFFKYYAFEFDYENNAISIRNSGNRIFSKEDKSWKALFAVEDPFETEFNTARNVSITGLDAIRYEFVRAFHLIQKQSNFKDVVCTKLSTLKI
ncbi:caffeine-induced death protein 1 [Naegleria gruberi]|uniref:RNA uridylyltransferase n=1 Tax=Naegleria gruberi TaxID=5762 RepID=D2VCW7_NAEGR|nr:caffeine-induced death protein 1 [Naegleria gruberi]EFC45494.1 caffeine-induced death protein 1 [Naegleria gruberi]|eukprot:XP_002678238.1 caffeine-induced death protein 1 [Naegleria gruberi strain NEG-M]